MDNVLASILEQLQQMNKKIQDLDQKMDKKFEEQEKRFDAKMADMEKRITAQFNAEMVDMEKRITAQFNAKMADMEKRLTKQLKAETKQLDQKWEERFQNHQEDISETLQDILKVVQRKENEHYLELSRRIDELTKEFRKFKEETQLINRENQIQFAIHNEKFNRLEIHEKVQDMDLYTLKQIAV